MFKSDIKSVPVNRPKINNLNIKYVTKSLEEGWISGEGPYVTKFENAFKKIFKKKFSISVSNGTAALEIAVAALGLKKGSKVIVPNLTIISCLNAILKNNLKPVFVDVDMNDYNICLRDLKSKISKDIKAIILVHTYGLSSNIVEIQKLKKKYNFKIIEDCAEGIGLKYKSKFIGSFGDISTFSFYSNKIITSGEGGCIITNEKKYFDFCKDYKNLSFGKKERFKHINMSGNYRMSSIQCAYALADLKFFYKNIRKKKEMGNFYLKNLAKYPFITLPPKKNLTSDNIFWVFPITIENLGVIKKNHFKSFLISRNVGVRDFFYPLSMQPFLKKSNIKLKILKNSLELYKKGIYIPSGLGNTPKELKYVVSVIDEYSKKYFKKK